jgi:hypothetical protein
MVIKFYSYAVELYRISQLTNRETNEWSEIRHIDDLPGLDEELENHINGKLLMMTSSAIGDHYVVTIAYDEEEVK